MKKLSKAKINRYNRDKAQSYFDMGSKHMQKKELPQAKELFIKAIKFNPYHVEAHINLGIIFYHTSTIEKSLDVFKKAHKLGPFHPRSNFWIGRLYYEIGKPQKAVKPLSKAVKLIPEFLEGHYYLGLVYNELEEYDLAIENLSTTLQIEPFWFDSLIHLGKAYYKFGDYQRAIQQLEQAHEILPQDHEVPFYLSQAYLEISDYDYALKNAAEAVSLNPNSAKAHYLKWKIHHKLDQTDEAKQEEELLLAIAPKYKYLILLNQRFIELSDTNIDKILKASHSMMDFLETIYCYFDQFKILTGLLKYKRFKSLFIQLFNLTNPINLASFRYLRGKKFLENNDETKAETYFKSACIMFPEYVSAHISLGLLYKQRKDYERAIKHLSKAQNLEKRNITVKYELGLLHKSIYNYHEAAKCFLRIIRESRVPKQYVDSYLLLAEIFLLTDRVNKAIKVLERSNLYDNHAEIYSTLGKMLLEKQNALIYIEQGIELLTKALELNHFDRSNYKLLGQAYFKLDNLQESHKWFKKIKYPDEETRYYLAKINLKHPELT